MELEIGEMLVLEKKVSKDDTASKYGSGMEEVSMKLVLPFLEDGYNTVGTEISVSHLKATPVGMNVTCNAELVEHEGRKLSFKVSAFDEQGKIGEGTHTRFIIDVEKFMSKLK